MVAKRSRSVFLFLTANSGESTSLVNVDRCIRLCTSEEERNRRSEASAAAFTKQTARSSPHPTASIQMRRV